MKKLSSEDRKSLIRLAKSLPEGSEERKSILAGLAQTKTANYSMEERSQFGKALSAFLDAVDLPSDADRAVRRMGIDGGSARVSVPAGFGSLFDEIEIELIVTNSRHGAWGRLRWSYTHPSGGSNGLTLGTVQVDPNTLQAGWRVDGLGGESGLIDPPRYPSDPF